MNIPVPKNIEDTQAKILLGLTLQQGFSVLIDAIIFIFWIMNDRPFPQPVLIFVLIFVAFLGFYRHQEMSAAKFLLCMGAFLLKKSECVYKNVFETKVMSKKEKKKIEKKLRKKIKACKKHGEEIIQPIQIQTGKRKGHKKNESFR